MIMKQKIAILGLCYIVATITASFFCANLYIIIFIMVGVILAVCFLSSINAKNKGAYILYGTIILVAVGSFALRYNTTITNVKPLYNNKYEVNGVVTDVYSRSGGYNSIAVYLPQSLNGYLPFDMTIQLNTYEYINIGEYINSEVMFEKVQQDEKRFEYNRTLSKKMYVNTFSYNPVYSGVKFKPPFIQSVKIFFSSIKENMSEKIDFYMNEKEAGVFKSLLIGDKSDMDYGIGLDFSYAGLAHILAISGLHISIIAGLLKRFFDRFYIHVFVSNIIIIVMIWGFVILTGLSNSTIRAGIMITITLLAYNLGEYSDNIHSLSISAVLILMINPFAIFDMGLTLSVVSTLGVIMASKWINKLIERFETDYKIFRMERTKAIIRSVTMTLGAIIFLMPFYVLVFKQLNLLVIIANIVIAPIVSLIIGLGFIFILLVIPFTMSLDFIYSMLGQIINTLCEVLIYIVELIARVPYTTIPFRTEFSVVWLIAFVVAVVYIVVKKIPLGLMRGGLFVSVYLVCSIVLLQWSNFNTVELVTFSDEKTGARTMVIISNVEADIININGDDFSNYELVTYLRQRGITRVNRYFDFDYQTKEVSVDTHYLIEALNVKAIHYGQSNEEIDDKYILYNKYSSYESIAVPIYSTKGFKVGKNVTYNMYRLSGPQTDYSIDLDVFDTRISIIPELIEEEPRDLIIVYKNAMNKEQHLDTPIVIAYDGVKLDKSLQNIVYDKTDNYRIIINSDGLDVKEQR